MSLRFVTKTIHAYLDYPVAIALIGMPFILGLGSGNPLAFWLSVVTGVAAFLLTILTDHHLGIFRVLSYKTHLTVDGLVGITFIAAPLLLGFVNFDFWYYAVLGAGVLVVVSLHQPEEAALRA